MVIEESEDVSKLNPEILAIYPNRLWFGDNENQGVLIASKEHYPLSIDKSYNPQFKYIIPLQVEMEQPLFIFAVWAQKQKDLSYSQQVMAAIRQYNSLLVKNCILTGDFNSNAYWDMKQKDSIHTRIVDYLYKYHIQSIYHFQTQELMGSETTGTHAFRRSKEAMYHLDYCFASKNLLEHMEMQIAAIDQWLMYSDHAPLIIDLSLSKMRGIQGF
jgi:exonuclease III